MRYYRQAFFYIRILADMLILLSSYLLTYILVPDSIIFRYRNSALLLFAIFSVAWLISAKHYGLYDEFRSRNFSFELIALIKCIIIQTIAAIFSIYMLKENDIPRKFVFVYPLIFLNLITLEKYLIRIILQSIRSRGRNLRSVMIIGAGPIGRQFYSEIMTNPHFGYRLVGFIDDKIQGDMNGQYLGAINELDKILEIKNADDIIIALPNYATAKIQEVVRICEKHPTRVRIIPDYFQFISDKYNVSMFGKFPIIAVRDHKINEFLWRLVKRGFDMSFTVLCFMFIFSWLFPLIILLIKLESKGPAFFRQERWGRNNKRFLAYKFRSMVASSSDVDENGKYCQATKDDPRITKFGKFLRKTNLDELPQFINVLKGELSIVGPRPHPTPLNLESREYVHKYMQRHLVKPGITGWAQVNGFRGETKNKKLMEKRVEYDLWYINNWSFMLDIQIIILTVWRMFKGDPNAY